MARKTATILIDATGRDNGKAFFIREMPASQAEMWAVRAFLALARSGVDVPEDIASSGLAGIASLGLKALTGLRFEEARDLMAEMFACIQMIPDPGKPGVMRALIEDDIEEVATRLRLRKEVLELHVDFSTAGALQTSA
jgi:hypothetical protein